MSKKLGGARAGAGRKPLQPGEKTVMLVVRIPASMYARLESISRSEGMSQAGWVRYMIGRSKEAKMVVIEKRDVEREYGFRGVDAIVQHRRLGRLLVCDGYGGQDTMQGGAVRWKHGVMVKLRDGDTFADLDADWNPTMTTITAVKAGYDESRPVMDMPGVMVERLAKAAGLS